MFQKFKLPTFILFWVVIILVLFDMGISDRRANVVAESEVIPEHQELNQKPEPFEMKQSGTDVYIKMNAQITDIEIKDGVTYKAWTFNGEAPGPVVVVNEGDTFILHSKIWIRLWTIVWIFMPCIQRLTKDLPM